MARPDWHSYILTGIQHSVAFELNRKKRLGEPIVIWDAEKQEPKILQADEYDFVDLTPYENFLAEERAADAAADNKDVVGPVSGTE